MTKLPITLAAVATLAACSTPIQKPTVIDYADAGTTALFVAQGYTEMNPIIGAAGDPAAPIVALVVKSVLRTLLPITGGISQDRTDAAVDLAGALGACNNIALIAGAANPMLYGAVCAAWSAYSNRDVLRGE